MWYKVNPALRLCKCSLCKLLELWRWKWGIQMLLCTRKRRGNFRFPFTVWVVGSLQALSSLLHHWHEKVWDSLWVLFQKRLAPWSSTQVKDQGHIFTFFTHWGRIQGQLQRGWEEQGRVSVCAGTSLAMGQFKGGHTSGGHIFPPPRDAWPVPLFLGLVVLITEPRLGEEQICVVNHSAEKHTWRR